MYYMYNIDVHINLLKSCIDKSLMYNPVLISDDSFGITGVPRNMIIRQLSMYII